MFSGFVIDIADVWFYVTAGHVLADIQRALASGATFDTWRLVDQAARGAGNNMAVPFDFEVAHWCVLEDTALGLDYAALPLGWLYRQQLAAGGVEALSREAWSDYTAAHEHWVLCGTPSESVDHKEGVKVDAKVVMVPLVETPAPATAGPKVANQFYAKLEEGSERFVRDVDGMSGGPIFMLHRANGTWKYNIIGVQSGWYRAQRVVAACPFTSFAEALAPIVEEAQAAMKDGTRLA